MSRLLRYSVFAAAMVLYAMGATPRIAAQSADEPAKVTFLLADGPSFLTLDKESAKRGVLDVSGLPIDDRTTAYVRCLGDTAMFMQRDGIVMRFAFEGDAVGFIGAESRLLGVRERSPMPWVVPQDDYNGVVADVITLEPVEYVMQVDKLISADSDSVREVAITSSWSYRSQRGLDLIFYAGDTIRDVRRVKTTVERKLPIDTVSEIAMMHISERWYAGSFPFPLVEYLAQRSFNGKEEITTGERVYLCPPDFQPALSEMPTRRTRQAGSATPTESHYAERGTIDIPGEGEMTEALITDMDFDGERLTITPSGTAPSDGSWLLCDVGGMVFGTSTVDGIGFVRFDTGNLPQGYYIIVAFLDGTPKAVRKILIER